MRIGILGASGLVGTCLVQLILDSPGLELAAALVSPGSRLAGTPVAGGGIEYRPADAEMNSHCDVMIDFSTPAASLSLQAQIAKKNIPTVIGTTGFSAKDDATLTGWCAHRPMLISANFARGFEAFRLASLGYARMMPDAEPRVFETYHARKKADPSGTSKLLAAEISKTRSTAMGFEAPETPITVKREGDIVGINEVSFDLGSAETRFTYRVHTRAAYAEGALAAAQWLVATPRPAGRYTLADSLEG
ncbi:dihydrodipicolinate reductase C-terminal domain-containing protein [Martelella sp. HB161492]|uniref:4-hydroxy-tetrahydrodipicolinate reductase n=1 Tax=Martelella sp. HB161492 TaxID=2720726 RepID=UPI001591A769|nr:dihydrodipicolinate reductase C-terminal domain-containing protein [Martelella sp. HB161492]